MNLSNPEVTIRRINGDDKAQWLALWQGYLDFTAPTWRRR